MSTATLQSRSGNKPQQVEDAIEALRRRALDAEKFNVADGYFSNPGNEKQLLKSIRETVRTIFGEASPEFAEYRTLSLCSDKVLAELPDDEVVAAKERGRDQLVAGLNKLIARLEKTAA